MPDPGDRLTHLPVVGRAQREEFARQGRGSFKKRTVDRAAHGRYVIAMLHLPVFVGRMLVAGRGRCDSSRDGP